MRYKIIFLFSILFLFGSAINPEFKLNNLGGKVTKVIEQIPKPTASIEKFDIKKISLRDITFTFDIGVNNPYPVGLNMDAVELDFSVEKHKLFHTATSKGFKVAAKGKAVSSFETTLTYESIIQLIKDYNSHDYLDCDIDVLVIIPIPKTVTAVPETVKLPFKLSQQIPAIKPKVSIAKFTVVPPNTKEIENALKKSTVDSVKKADPKKVMDMFTSLIKGDPVAAPEIKPQDIDLKFKVNFDIVLENQAKAPLSFNSLHFEFLVNSDQLVQGDTTKFSNSAATTILQVVNEFSSKNLSKAVVDAFKNGTGTFTVKGNTSLNLPPLILNHPLVLDFNETGTFNLR